MIDALLSHIAPHYCCSCGSIGAFLRSNCKYDIVCESCLRCILCEVPTQNDALCTACAPAYSRAWCVGMRRDGLLKLIDAYKFQRVYAAANCMADLLDSVIPDCQNVIVVSVPTVPQHVRQRGHDHAYTLA